MPRNEKDSKMDWFCAWVLCVERERERERDKQKNTITKSTQKKGNEKVRMHEQCMSM